MFVLSVLSSTTKNMFWMGYIYWPGVPCDLNHTTICFVWVKCIDLVSLVAIAQRNPELQTARREEEEAEQSTGMVTGGMVTRGMVARGMTTKGRGKTQVAHRSPLARA